MTPFLFALKAPETKRQYSRNLKLFFDFALDSNLTLSDQADLFVRQALTDGYWATNYLMQFFQHQIDNRLKATNEIAAGTVRNYYKAAKLFCIMNDINLNWLKITKGLPKVKYYSDDRAPTLEEIKRLIEYPDRRIKPIIYTMLSSGIRIGAWDYLKWKHVKPVKSNKGEVTAAKLSVYSGDVEEYYSFITPEAYSSLLEWMDYRKSYGEKISGESWLMRDIWQISERSYGATFALAENPKKLNSFGVKSLIERAIHAQGLWQPLTDVSLIGRANQHDVLIVAIIGLAFGLSFIAFEIGISVATGAFFAGVLIAESKVHSVTRVLTTPIKDVFGAVFFVSVGALMDITQLPLFIVPALILILVSIGAKFLTVFIAARSQGYKTQIALRAAFGLSSSGGELALVVAKGGTDVGTTSSFVLPMVGAMTIITTFITPYMIKMGWKLADRTSTPGKGFSISLRRHKK